jgi:hypothetical protein
MNITGANNQNVEYGNKAATIPNTSPPMLNARDTDRKYKNTKTAANPLDHTLPIIE